MNRHRALIRALVISLAAAIPLAVLAPAALAASATFTYVPAAGEDATSASVRGTMNGWGETAMTLNDDGQWSVTIDLDPGEHVYKFFINGDWPQNMETDHGGGPLDAQATHYIDDGFGGQNAVRVVGSGGGGGASAATNDTAADVAPAPPLRDGFARVHYHRPDQSYADWGLHVWEHTTESVTWDAPLVPAGRDEYGIWWDIGLTSDATRVAFIVHRGDEKDPGPDQILLVEEQREFWLLSGRETIHDTPPDVDSVSRGDLTRRRAHWLAADTLVWDAHVPDGATVHLHAAFEGGMTLEKAGPAGAAETFELTPTGAALPADLRRRFPHLAGYAVYTLPSSARDRTPDMLRGQLAVTLTLPSGELRGATGVQIPGVLDDLFSWDGPLGVTWSDSEPSLTVWAPTARSVRLMLFNDSTTRQPDAVVPMTFADGVWTAQGRTDWKNRFYLYEVEVWVPSTGKVETNLVTDPYSVSLSMNSTRSQIVDLTDPALMPPDWSEVKKAPLDAPEDIVLWELHVRDFSAFDPDVPEPLRGTYLAFAENGRGRRHLKRLAEAGLTHVHLLPTFDIATVNEDRSTWRDPGDLSKLASDSEDQQARVNTIRAEDAFNWGYDPFHFGVPEGSYSTEPDGAARILEFRRAVQAISKLGLRVVMDVVYNHTHASGQSDRSVLDRIVPGYYHRLTADGQVETSTCCQNTATEHAMMERLMVDDLVHWAVDYKIDGFRFDLMGHHMKRNLEAARTRLHSLTLEKDGVDGQALYLYGEGWDFGEVGGGARGTNATQPAMAGTGVGTFNDRIRDAIRGGNPFGDRREQGFSTGLFVAPSEWSREHGGATNADGARAVMDRVRVGLAGNLRDWRFTGRSGMETRGGEHNNGGYGADPEDTIQYASAHDNETLFDKIQIAAPETASLEDRVRMHRVALSVVALSQGIPFFHAGSEMLRSKSMDRDSYDSGDWFNRLDFTYETNNFGVGLPIADKNQERWAMMEPLLANESLTPSRRQIEGTVAHFEEMLRIRRDSPLFRMREAREIQSRIRFRNVGRDQVPGLIVMTLNDRVPGPPDADPVREELVVIFNATPTEQVWQSSGRKGMKGRLHPIQADSKDKVTRQSRYDNGSGTFRVPAWTTAVFEFVD